MKARAAEIQLPSEGIAVILHRTSVPGNLGATARAMANTGFSRLILCHLVVTLPTRSPQTSYNLAQAVLLVLFHLMAEEEGTGTAQMAGQSRSHDAGSAGVPQPRGTDGTGRAAGAGGLPEAAPRHQAEQGEVSSPAVGRNNVYRLFSYRFRKGRHVCHGPWGR